MFETQARIPVTFANNVAANRQLFVAGLKTSYHEAGSPSFFTQPTNNYFTNVIRPASASFTYYRIDYVAV